MNTKDKNIPAPNAVFKDGIAVDFTKDGTANDLFIVDPEAKVTPNDVLQVLGLAHDLTNAFTRTDFESLNHLEKENVFYALDGYIMQAIKLVNHMIPETTGADGLGKEVSGKKGKKPRDSDAAFARSLDMNPRYYSQLKAGKTMGSNVARKIEEQQGIESGWMDHDHTPSILSEAPTAAPRETPKT